MSKKTLIFSGITLFLPVICGLLLWNELPAQIATHFDVNGVPNGYSSKVFTVFVIPLIMAAVQLACVLGVSSDKKARELNGKIKNIIMWICPVLSNAVFVCIYGMALGHGIDIASVFSAIMGLEFIIIGNYLPKCRQNSVIGIRVPWTLSNEEVWDRSHRLAGKIWVVCGFALLLDALIDIWPFWVSLAAVIVSVLIPLIYSAVIYGEGKKQ